MKNWEEFEEKMIPIIILYMRWCSYPWTFEHVNEYRKKERRK